MVSAQSVFRACIRPRFGSRVDCFSYHANNFMTLLIGAFNPLTLEKVRHYPHPRPIIERTVKPTN